MSGYKVGDKVRVADTDELFFTTAFGEIASTIYKNEIRGQVATVVSELVDGDYQVEASSNFSWVNERFLSPVPDEAATGEVRTTSSTGAQKGVKPERYDLIPVEALAEVARHYGRGAEKYAAHNWRKGYEWSKSFAALMRHAQQFWAGENIDEETGSHHMAGVVFHALSLITFTSEHPEMDDRWARDEG